MQTILSFFEENAARFPTNAYLKEKIDGVYQELTYSAVKEQVYRFAAGLMVLGVKKGDRIALLSEGRSAWVIAELGILYTGAINIPLSVKLTEPDEFLFRLTHAGVRMMIVSGGQVRKVRSLCKSLEDFQKLILLDGEADDEFEMTYEDLLTSGDLFLAGNSEVFDSIRHAVSPDDPANICYTSGTTAQPKGIVLTHNNYVSNVKQAYSRIDIPAEFTSLLILPWDHAFAHTAGIYCLMGMGASFASVQVGKTGIETLKNIPVNIKEVRPHILHSVPALAANFKKSIEKSIREKGPIVNALFQHALRISYAYNNDGFRKGRGLSFLYKPMIKLYDKILFSKVREGFGGRLKFFVGGGALLDIEFQKFFYAVGMPMLQGYGLTEAAPIISANSLARLKFGSSGLPVKGMELKICDTDRNDLATGDKGEICVKGPNVMKEYWGNPEATAETLSDGWLYTGDMGYVDTDGFLYVLGRFKSLLIADDGEKYSPEGIEEAYIGQSKYISQCMLYNNQKPYTIALIVIEKLALISYLKHKGLIPDSEEGIREAIACIGHEFDQYRKHGRYADMFPQRWLPAAFGVLSAPFSEDNHMINSTMKMVRGKITEHYSTFIDFLYTPEGKDIFNKQNLENMKKILSTD